MNFISFSLFYWVVVVGIVLLIIFDTEAEKKIDNIIVRCKKWMKK